MDTDGDVIIVAGDFIVLAVVYHNSINIYVSHRASTSIIIYRPVRIFNVRFTSYGALPTIPRSGEFCITSAVADYCTSGKLYMALFEIRMFKNREWQPVPDCHRHVIEQYLHSLMSY